MREFMTLLEDGQSATPSELLAQIKHEHHTPEDLVHGDLSQRVWKFSKYVMRELPIDDLDLTEWDVDHDRAMEYAARGEGAPPIIYDADAGSIIDGTHRANAASLRGQETIQAWVGLSQNIDPDHEELDESVGGGSLILYHGTCADSAAALCEHGWEPRTGFGGGNGGQARFLYLSSGLEDAEWFAHEKGCTSVVALTSVPMEYLQVDPEDGIGDTVEEELNNAHGMPGKVVLTRPLGPEHFQLVRA